MVKIIGFVKNIDEPTTEGKMEKDSFKNACKMIAERTGTPFNDYYTKRQCSKFYKGRGIVFNELTK